MSATELETKKEYDELLKSTPLVIVLAHAQYSPNSRTFKSEFSDLAGKHASDGKLAFGWFNAFDADDINAELMVRTFPAYFIFKDGQRVKGVQSSTASKETLEKDIDEFAKG